MSLLTPLSRTRRVVVSAFAAGAFAVAGISASAQTLSFDVLPDRDIWECDEELFETFTEREGHEELLTKDTEHNWTDWSDWFDGQCGLGIANNGQTVGFVLGFAAVAAAVAATAAGNSNDNNNGNGGGGNGGGGPDSPG